MLSKHAKQRLRTRATKSTSIIKKVIEEGYSIEKFCGDVRSFLEMKKFNGSNESKILRVYNQAIYVLDSTLTLVTILNIPGSLLTAYNKQIKRITVGA